MLERLAYLKAYLDVTSLVTGSMIVSLDLEQNATTMYAAD